MLTLIERDYSSDSKHHRAQLYLATYALLGLTFLATVAKSGTSTDLFVPLFVCSLLTGALALVLRTDWFATRPEAPRQEQRAETQSRKRRDDAYPNAERLDRIASLRSDRHANRPLTSLAASFPEFDQKNGNGGSQPVKEAPQKSSRPRDPFSSALTDFDNRKKV